MSTKTRSLEFQTSEKKRLRRLPFKPPKLSSFRARTIWSRGDEELAGRTIGRGFRVENTQSLAVDQALPSDLLQKVA